MFKTIIVELWYIANELLSTELGADVGEKLGSL